MVTSFYLLGEAKLVLAARQLMRSCQLYEDCISTLKSSFQEQQLRLSNLSGSGKDSVAAINAKKAIEQATIQIQSDVELLNKIQSSMESLVDSSTKRNVFVNALVTLSTKRDQTMVDLSNQLMSRVQLMTAMMTKDLWKVRSRTYSLIMQR